MLATGSLVLLAAAVVAASDLRAMRRASLATGVYLDSVARVGGSHGGTFLHPRFAFRPAPGPQSVAGFPPSPPLPISPP